MEALQRECAYVHFRMFKPIWNLEILAAICTFFTTFFGLKTSLIVEFLRLLTAMYC